MRKLVDFLIDFGALCMELVLIGMGVAAIVILAIA